MIRAQERGLESGRVASWLRDAIIDGIRQPGSRLIERDLAGEFGVSRVPVRDALKVLEAEGLVELRPRTWAVVRKFTLADLVDLDEVREVLEPMAFRLAAERHRPDGLERLRSVLQEAQECGDRADAIAARRAAADFHEVVVALAENGLLADLMKSMRSRLRWSLVLHDDLAQVTDEHVALFEAVRDRDGERAGALAHAHVESTRRGRLSHATALRDAAGILAE